MLLKFTKLSHELDLERERFAQSVFTTNNGCQMMMFGNLTPLQVLKEATKEFIDDGMTTYAAALAYRVLFSLFPFLIFLIALLGLLHVPQLFDWLRQQAALLVPGEAMDQVNAVIDGLQTPRGGLLSFGIALAIWSASAGVLALMDALNVAYDVIERRPTWKRILLSIVYTITMAIVLIAAAGLMVLGPQAAGWIAERLGVEQVFVTVWSVLRWPLALVLLMLTTSVVYYALPNTRQPFRFVTPGAVISVVIWILASVGFGFYVQNFGNYDATYGSIGAVIILMFYFYLSAALLLFGAEVNGVVEAARAPRAQQRDKDEREATRAQRPPIRAHRA
ncbi:MAG TPA: YihY/virulence factor BrkB family protein [Burkholderiales bacterium]|nr:YihY/virulence factor BrkB family protein [Burkholderiales bacterium]